MYLNSFKVNFFQESTLLLPPAAKILDLSWIHPWTEDEVLDQMAISIAGTAAEELVYGGPMLNEKSDL